MPSFPFKFVFCESWTVVSLTVVLAIWFTGSYTVALLTSDETLPPVSLAASIVYCFLDNLTPSNIGATIALIIDVGLFITVLHSVVFRSLS